MIKRFQNRILRNKIKKGFPIRDIPFDLSKVQEELKEFEEAFLANDKENMAEELADVLIMVLGIAAYYDFDMRQEILKKLLKIERRKITQVGHNKFEKEEA